MVTGATSGIGRTTAPAFAREGATAVVLWLCSPEAALTVGHAMVVDGGQTV